MHQNTATRQTCSCAIQISCTQRPEQLELQVSKPTIAGWKIDEFVIVASGKKCHTELHIMLVSDDKVGLSRLQKNRGEVTFFFKFDRRVDGAKCNRPDPTWDPQVDWGRLIGVDSQV